MNYLKIYTLLLCTVLTTACSDDEEQFNSGAATVNLQETAMTVKESAGLCTVPVVVWTKKDTSFIKTYPVVSVRKLRNTRDICLTTWTCLLR